MRARLIKVIKLADKALRESALQHGVMCTPSVVVVALKEIKQVLDGLENKND